MAGAVGARRSDSRPIFYRPADGKSHANPPLLIQFTVMLNKTDSKMNRRRKHLPH